MNKLLSTLSTRLPDFGQVIKRFPIAAAIMACVTLYLIVYGLDRFRGPRALAITGISLAAYFAMMQTIWAEARARKPNWVLQILIALAMGVLFYHSEKINLNVMMIIFAVLLLIGNSVRFGRARDDLHVWDFTHKIWTAAGFAILGSMIYFAGVMAIMAALKVLFGINIERLIEHLIIPIGLVFLAPLYWLSNVPPVDESTEYLSDSPSFVSKAVAFLGTWILAPLTLIYALILLAYAVKIVLQMELPKGEIAQLTTPFLLIGTLTWLLLEPPFIQTNTLARLFRKFWFVLSVPAAIMLSISIAVRVGEYGLTLQRILLILACFWSLGLAAWFTFAPKGRRDIRIIPALAAILLIAAAPMSHYLSNNSQAARFESNLRAAGILQADGTIKTDNISDKAAAGKAKGALKYLTLHDGRKSVEKVLERSGITIKAKQNKYNLNKTLANELGLKSIKEKKRHSRFAGEAVLSSDEFRQVRDRPVDVAGFEILYRANYYNVNMNKLKGVATLVESDGFILKRDMMTLIVSDGSNDLYTYDLKAWMDALPNDSDTLNPEDTQLRIVDTQDHQVELVFENLKRTIYEGGNKAYAVNFDVLTSGFTSK